METSNLRINLRLLALAFAFFAYPLSALAQDSFSVRAGESLILTDPRYHSKLFEGTAANTTFDIKLAWKDKSGSVFDGLYRHPSYGIGLSTELTELCRFQGESYLTNIYNVYGFVDRPMIATDKLIFQYTLGLGLGYSSGIYHPVDNPWNQILGSRVTAHISLGLELFYRLGNGSDLGLGVYYNHNSNGTTQLPNCGYNGLEAALTLRHNFEKEGLSRQERGRTLVSTGDAEVSDRAEFRKGFNYDVWASGSANVLGSEFQLYDTSVEDPSLKRYRFPLYPKFAFGADVMYRYGRRVSSGLGVDVFCSTYTKRLLELDRQLHPDEQIEAYHPLSVGISAQQEFFYRNLSLRLCMGAYLYKKDGQNMSCRLYEIMALRYYVPRAANVFVSLGLKAHHFTAAECILLSVGKRF